MTSLHSLWRLTALQVWVTLFLVEAASHLELASSLALLGRVGVVLALLAARAVSLERVLG